MNEDKATRYHRRRRRAQLLAQATAAGVLLLLVVSGAARWLADVANRLAGAGPATSLQGFVMATVLFTTFVGLPVLAARFPIDVFREWTLDRVYGLDRGAFGVWLRDYLRGVVVLGFATAGAMVVVRTAGWAGRAWWVVAALALWGSQVVWTVVMPPLLRVLGSMKPLGRPHVVDRLRLLGGRAGTTLDVYEWRAGEDSRGAHAALAGAGRTRSVILSDTLLDSLTIDEIEVVVAHELAHHVHGDMRTALLWTLVVVSSGLGTASVALYGLGSLVGPTAPWELATQPVIALVAWVVAAGLSPVGLALSRAKERRADRFAIELTSNAEAFLTSMRRLAASNLLEERPSFLTRMLSSHPSIHERIAAAARRSPAR